MSDRIVADTVILMTLASFCANDTHLKTLKAHILETTRLQLQRRYRAQSCNLEWSYRVGGIGDLDLPKESQNALIYFSVQVR